VSVFLFSPQGSQWRGMGRYFYRHEPVFQQCIAACDAEVRRHLGWSLLDEFETEAAGAGPFQGERIQPTVTALQIALTKLLAARGVYPAAVAGLSMGELAATVSAGVLTLEDAMLVACGAGRLTREALAAGQIAIVHVSTEVVHEYLNEFNEPVSIAVELSPNLSVISGNEAAIASAISKLTERGVRCQLAPIGFAFHSPLMLPLQRSFLGPLRRLSAEPGFLPVYSSVTGAQQPGTRFDRAYWWSIVYKPASFRSAIESVLSDGYTRFVEIGPHPILLSSVHDIAHASGRDVVRLSVMQRSCDGLTELERLVHLESAT
jgi:acyl transferase domain-containing protein